MEKMENNVRISHQSYMIELKLLCDRSILRQKSCWLLMKAFCNHQVMHNMHMMQKMHNMHHKHCNA